MELVKPGETMSLVNASGGKIGHYGERKVELLTEDRVILEIFMAININFIEIIEGFAKTQNSQSLFQQHIKKSGYDYHGN